MATQNRYAFLLNRRGKQNTADIYAQLQAPAQRSAYTKALEEVISATQPTRKVVGYEETVTGVDQFGFPIYGPPDYSKPIFKDTPGSTATAKKDPVTGRYTGAYEPATIEARKATRSATLNPAELVKAYSTNPIGLPYPGTVPNAYLFPVSEQTYDRSPQFSAYGEVVGGIGAKPSRFGNTVDSLVATRRAEQAFDDAYNAAATNPKYDITKDAKAQQANYDALLAVQRTMPGPAVGRPGAEVFVNGVQGYYDNFGKFITNPAITGVPFNYPTVGTMVSGLTNPQLAPLSFLRHQGLAGLGPPASYKY